MSTTDDAEQARQIQSVLDDNEANARYDRVYLYALKSNFAGGDYCGLVRPNGKRRSAAATLATRTAR